MTTIFSSEMVTGCSSSVCPLVSVRLSQDYFREVWYGVL